MYKTIYIKNIYIYIIFKFVWEATINVVSMIKMYTIDRESNEQTYFSCNNFIYKSDVLIQKINRHNFATYRSRVTFEKTY